MQPSFTSSAGRCSIDPAMADSECHQHRIGQPSSLSDRSLSVSDIHNQYILQPQLWTSSSSSYASQASSSGSSRTQQPARKDTAARRASWPEYRKRGREDDDDDCDACTCWTRQDWQHPSTSTPTPTPTSDHLQAPSEPTCTSCGKPSFFLRDKPEPASAGPPGYVDSSSPETSTPSKRAPQTPLLLPERLKKRKLSHRIRSFLLLRPPGLPMPGVDGAADIYHITRAPAWLKNATSDMSRESRMMPREWAWSGNDADEHNWLITSMERAFSRSCGLQRTQEKAEAEERAQVAKAIEKERLDAFERAARAAQAAKEAASSFPPTAHVVPPSPSNAAQPPLVAVPPQVLKAQLLAILRSRLGDAAKAGDAPLRMKKFVVWNAWMRRKADSPAAIKAQTSPQSDDEDEHVASSYTSTIHEDDSERPIDLDDDPLDITSDAEPAQTPPASPKRPKLTRNGFDSSSAARKWIAQADASVAKKRPSPDRARAALVHPSSAKSPLSTASDAEHSRPPSPVRQRMHEASGPQRRSQRQPVRSSA